MPLKALNFGPGKYGEFSAAPTVDPTMAHVHLNKRPVRALATASIRILIGATRITIVELVHRRTFVDLANLAS